MLLLKDDVRGIVSLGFKEDFFAVEFRGFKFLRNNNCRFVFHDGEQYTIYPNRPLECRLYPDIGKDSAVLVLCSEEDIYTALFTKHGLAALASGAFEAFTEGNQQLPHADDVFKCVFIPYA